MCDERLCAVALLARARALLDDVAISDLVLVTGQHAQRLRCMAHQGRLLILAPRSPELAISGRTGSARVLVERWSHCHFDDLSALMLTGWISEVGMAERLGAADAFACRHPTGDLLDLDGDWLLATFEAGEAHFGTSQGGLSLDSADSLDQLLA